LGERGVRVEWRPDHYSVVVGRTNAETRHDQRDVYDRLKRKGELTFLMEQRRGAIDLANRRNIPVRWDDVEWSIRRRPLGGLNLVRSGSTVAKVGLWKIDVGPEANEIDLAVALVVALYELDMRLAPLWLLAVDSLIPILNRWPAPLQTGSSRRRHDHSL
jgi:hypothetical protein